MSASSNNNNNNNNNNESAQANRFAFQHFDQECDFGIENEEGERVRKRKRPGRKPNPPTLQERRAQNRAAQKAFREREQQRKAEKDKKWEEYQQEIKVLKAQLATTQFEARYLKACVLHLTLACLIHRGSVPHIWTESRIIPSNSNGEYKKPVFAPYGQHIQDEAHQIPALLDMILENKCIVDFDKALFATTQNSSFSNFMKRKGGTANLDAFSAYQSYITEETITINKSSQEPRKNFPHVKKKAKTTEAAAAAAPSPSTVSSPTSQQDQQSIFSQASTSPSPSSSKRKLSSVQQPSPPQERSSPKSSNKQLEDDVIVLSPQQGGGAERQREQDQSKISQALTIQQKPIKGVIFDPPAFKTSEDFVDMPSLQALHILRLQLKLGSILGPMTPAALLPTALQRVIPHDIRIDYVPGASIRDRMIIFQDYYNIDECFQFLTQNTVFMGGDVRDTRNWVIDPKYSLKFWFLSHQLVDQTYDDCLDKEEAAIVVGEYMDQNDDEDSDMEGQGRTSAERSTTTSKLPKKPFIRGNSHQNVYFREI